MSTNDPKHTPGPWAIGYDTETRKGVNAANVFSVAKDAEGFPQCIAQMPGLFLNTTLAEQERAALDRADVANALANARLIASAPDLLAALESAALTMDNAANLLLGDTDENVAIAEHLTACAMSARAAIAKARGVA